MKSFLGKTRHTREAAPPTNPEGPQIDGQPKKKAARPRAGRKVRKGDESSGPTGVQKQWVALFESCQATEDLNEATSYHHGTQGRVQPHRG